MVKFLRAMWNQDDGFILSTELVLVGSALAVGAVAGLTSVRDTVVNELNDVGQALSQVDQSYSYDGVYGHGAYTAGSCFRDFRSVPGPYRPGYGGPAGYYGYGYGTGYGGVYGEGGHFLGPICPPEVPYAPSFGYAPTIGYGAAYGGFVGEGGSGYAVGGYCPPNQCTVVCAAAWYTPPTPRFLDF